MPTARYHCNGCGWAGETPPTREETDALGTWTLRVCPDCGEEVYAIVGPSTKPPRRGGTVRSW